MTQNPAALPQLRTKQGGRPGFGGGRKEKARRDAARCGHRTVSGRGKRARGLLGAGGAAGCEQEDLAAAVLLPSGIVMARIRRLFLAEGDGLDALRVQ